MSRRALDPGAKPFEVKVGVGFQAFGGMYQLGDPSMCPPNRFRKLINVRLGGKDVESRQGQVTTWTSPAGEPVVGMIQVLKRETPAIFFGPGGSIAGGGNSFRVWWAPTTATTYTKPLYHSLLLDSPYTINPMPSDRVLTYIQTKLTKYDDIATDQEKAQWTEFLAAVMAPVAHQPYVFQQDAFLLAGQGREIIRNVRRPYHSASVLRAVSDADPVLWTEASFTHEHLLEDVFTSGGIIYQTLFPDDGQWGNCLDPIVKFQGKWLAAGGIVPLYLNPGVLGSKASGDPGTGQQVFEVNFNTEIRDEPPPGLAEMYSTPPPDAVWQPGVVDNFFGGGVSELFRMPGVSVSAIPTRASGGLTDGDTIRSMCVRQTRADNPISAAQTTSEKLYIGTFGGAPLTPGAWKTVDVEYKYPIHNLTDGKVYSWDGSTLKLETSGLGPAVVVCTLPDGGVIACGRTAAKYLAPGQDAWADVLYNPLPSPLPRAYSGVPEELSLSTEPDPDWLPTGFLWTDRVVFRGEAYFVGWDTAFLASNAHANGATDFGLVPPIASGFPFYAPSVDAWALYKFDRGAMEMVEMRRGTEIEDAIDPTPPAPATFKYLGGSNEPAGFSLAVWNDRLYYSWVSYWHSQPPPLGTSKIGSMAGCGAYDGSVFDDDAVYYLDDASGLATTGEYDKRVTDMLSVGDALYVSMHYISNFTGAKVYSALYEWNGTVLVERVASWGDALGTFGAVYLQPGLFSHRMFMGVR